MARAQTALAVAAPGNHGNRREVQGRLYVVDTFISPSQDLAIVQRKDCLNPRTLATMLPTLDYTDRSKWDRIELVDTVAAVTCGLAEGKYEAGLGYDCRQAV